jgi:hypothetical protein
MGIEKLREITPLELIYPLPFPFYRLLMAIYNLKALSQMPLQ